MMEAGPRHRQRSGWCEPPLPLFAFLHTAERMLGIQAAERAERAAREEFGDVVWVKAAARAAWAGSPVLRLDGHVFYPYTVRPEILNRAEVARAMEREYPPLLRDVGIGGTVSVSFYVDEEGVVRETRIQDSSGYPALDEAALAVADAFRFRPALNRDRRVAVWVAFPIRFRVQ